MGGKLKAVVLLVLHIVYTFQLDPGSMDLRYVSPIEIISRKNGTREPQTIPPDEQYYHLTLDNVLYVSGSMNGLEQSFTTY
jgi:hypothetical protein